MQKIILISFIFFFSNLGLALAKNKEFLTLRYDIVNLRQGPGKDYPIKIFYKKNFFLFKLKINQIILEKLKIMKITLVGFIFLN